MSALTSVIAVSWSTVSVKPNASSISACHGVSGPNACPAEACRFAYSDTSSPAISLTALRAFVLVLTQSQPAHRRGLPTDIPRQLVQRIHWHIKLVGSVLTPFARRVLQHQILAPGSAD